MSYSRLQDLINDHDGHDKHFFKLSIIPTVYQKINQWISVTHDYLEISSFRTMIFANPLCLKIANNIIDKISHRIHVCKL